MIRILQRPNDLVHDDCKAIPIHLVLDAIDKMKYATPERCMFIMSFLTGCRQSELNRMYVDKLYKVKDGYYIYWSLGKKQKGFRKEPLPEWFVEELFKMRNNYRCFQNKMFPILQITFRRYFNRDIRPSLNQEWVSKTLQGVNGELKPLYKYHLSGLRKTFQILLFYKFHQLSGSLEVALHQVSSRMKHSCTNITYRHYLDGYDQIKVHDHGSMLPIDFLEAGYQSRLMEWCVV